MPLAIQGIDEAVLLWIQEAVRQAWLDPVVKAFTTLGNAGILWIVLSVAMLFWRPTRKAGLLAGCALIFSLLFTNLGLKLICTRPRPYTVVEGLIPLLTSGDQPGSKSRIEVLHGERKFHSAFIDAALHNQSRA